MPGCWTAERTGLVPRQGECSVAFAASWSTRNVRIQCIRPFLLFSRAAANEPQERGQALVFSIGVHPRSSGVVSVLSMIGSGILGMLKVLAEREEYARISTDSRFEGDKLIYRS